jgi:hypothetical protein
MRRLMLGAYEIIIPQSTQHGEKLLWIFQVLTELPSVGVRLANLTCCVAFHGKQ